MAQQPLPHAQQREPMQRMYSYPASSTASIPDADTVNDSGDNSPTIELSKSCDVVRDLDSPCTKHDNANRSSLSAGSDDHDNSAAGKQTEDAAAVLDVEQDDRDNTAELMRTATWLNTVFLLLCDVLGPANAPYAIATLGYVPGCILYFIFGVVAAYTGMVLSRLYLHYDTDSAPCHSYGDIAERVFQQFGPKWGKYARAYTAVLQALQLLLNVAVIILGSGQAMYQMSNNSVCFITLTIAFTAAGFLLGFIKQLRHIGHLSVFSIWIVIFSCIATVAVAATSGAMTNVSNPAPSSLLSAGFVPVDPATGEGLLPAHGVAFNSMPLDAMMSGIGNLVYAYGGATIFVELMSEMKNARDFWKSWAVALTVIMVIYFAYGVALYALQGPYVGNPGNQGISDYAWQTALNAIGLYTGLIAAVMYGNVGMKIIYQTVGQELLNAPALTTRRGTVYWCIFATCFWWVAFILAEAIPQFSAFTSIVSALTIMQFTYVIPSVLQFLHEVQQDKTWRERLLRRWWLKALDLTIALGSVALMGLMLWSSISVLIQAIETGTTQQFGCTY